MLAGSSFARPEDFQKFTGGRCGRRRRHAALLVEMTGAVMAVSPQLWTNEG